MPPELRMFPPLAVNPYQKRSKKNKLLIEPLFPRCLFIRAIPEVQNLAPVRSTRGVNGMVKFGTKLVAVPKEIINSVKSRICAETGLVQLEPVPVKPGDKVKVFDGPLAGLKGILQEHCSQTRSITNRIIFVSCYGVLAFSIRFSDTDLIPC